MFIIIYLCFFFYYFEFILTVLCFGVIPSSKINDCLQNITGCSGGAHFDFKGELSLFTCNGKYSGFFLEGLQLNYVLIFFFFFFFFFLVIIFILFLLMSTYV
jgi:hypothetical protein